MVILNVGLKNTLLQGGGKSFTDAMNGGKVYVFGGPIPASADVAATNAVLLATVTKNGDGSTGLTFGTPTNGVLPKTAAETWECMAANITAGTATFYRHCGPSDTATTAAGTPILCVQGIVGTDSSFDMTVQSVGLSSSFPFGPITSYEIAL
jgi:hypothetical protein